MFADDSKLLKVIKNVNGDFTAIQGDLDGLTNWSLTNEIYFQPPKCLHLGISRKRKAQINLTLYWELNLMLLNLLWILELL